MLPFTEKSEDNRSQLLEELKSWNIRLLNTNEDDDGVFHWQEKDRAEYTAKLRLLQTKTENQKMPDEMQTFINKPKVEEGCLEYKEVITAKERKCFLRGVAGIGKTSLIEYLALMWAKGELFLEENGNSLFDFLFLIKCRELEEDKAETLEDFFKREFDVDIEKLKYHGKRILIIVDGLDEDAELEKSIGKKTKLRALLKRNNNFLKDHATIITGRPHIESVLNRVQDTIGEYKRIEIAGLTPTEINKHIDVIANDNKAAATKIKVTIHSSPNMLELAAIPQYLGTLCHVIAMQGEGTTMITDTMTPLYVWSLASFWIQHVQHKGHKAQSFYETFSDEKVAKSLINVSWISFELLKKNKIVFKEGEFLDLKQISKEHQEMFNTFFIKKQTHRRPSYQFQHLTLHEFFAATHCMLKKIKVEELLELELYEVVRFIGGFIAAKESTDDENIVKLYIECLENAQEKEEESVQVVQHESGAQVTEFFNSVLEYLKDTKGKSVFAQHYSLSLFHEMFENASGESNQSMANLNIDVITHFQTVLDHPAFIYYAMAQIELSYLVHFIESLFANGFQCKLNEMTLRIRFSSLENEEILKRLFKSFFFFKNVWFTGCNFASYPWEMMNQSGSFPPQSYLSHLYIETCKMEEDEFKQLSYFLPFAEKVELINLELSEANCQQIINAFTKEHDKEKTKSRELVLAFCKMNDGLKNTLKSLKTVDAHFFKCTV